MRLDQDNQDRTWEPEDDGQWTKEEAKRDPRFDFAAFLGPESLDDQITDALDGKDLLDEEAYGEFAPDYVRRRGAPGERGRHEAPGPEPEEEEEEENGGEDESFDDGLETRRFTEDEMDFDEDEEPDFQEELPQRTSFVDEPPPRPKVVVAQPAPTVYVDPQSEYGPEEQSGGGGGSGLKWVIALLISAAVVVGGLLFATMVLPGLGGGTPGQTEEPASTNSGLLSGLLRPRPTQAPASEPTPVQPSAPPAVKTYTITVTAGSGGSISPNGRVSVEEGSSASFTILPDPGYELAQLLIDGSNVSIQDNYTFSDVRQDHQIYAVFQASPVITEPPPPTAVPTAEPTQEPVLTPEPPPVVEGEVGNLGPAE